MSLCATYIAGGTDGGMFVHIEPQNGGWGATATCDGASGLIAITDGDTYNYPIELLEAKFPLLVHRYDYNVEGGAGAGQHRGGFGLVREYEIACDEATLYGSFGRNATRPWGTGGGGGGSTNAIEVVRGAASTRLVRPSHFALRRGDRVRIITGGGGGWGNPFDRPPEAVAEDVRAGLLGAAEAAQSYGVVLDHQTGASTKRRPARAGPPRDDPGRDGCRRHVHRSCRL